MRSIEKSLEYYNRAIDVIPGGAQVISKRYDRLVRGVSPAFISHGGGAYIYDLDNNKYLDWSASLGPVILGYCPIEILNEKKELFLGSLPLSSISEVYLAERLVELIPCAEMVRFFKTGSDATSAAVRLCRYVTNRDTVICMGYHGWHDWYACTLPDPKCGGCTISDVRKIDYGDLVKMERMVTYYKPACIIMEPMSRQCPEKANSEFLSDVKKLCRKHGVLLVFDEIIMGFRYAMAGGQEYYGVTPDLATYSKAMGNGYPISALVGKRDIMKQITDLQVSGTFFGDTLGFEIVSSVIGILQNEPVFFHISLLGNHLIFGIQNIIKKFSLFGIVEIKGFGPWSSFVWSNDDCYHFFMQETIKHGIFYNRDHFVMYAHTEDDITKTLSVYEQIFDEMAELLKNDLLQSRLEGEFTTGLLK